MPGEKFLTPAEKLAAVESMRPDELEVLGDVFAEDAPGLVVAYARREVQVVSNEDGTVTLEPVGVTASGTESSQLSIPSTAMAGGTKPGTSLYASIVVTRTRSSPPYEWELQAYSDWIAGSTGMDAINASEDSMGVAWAGGLYIYSDYSSGKYKTCAGTELPLDIYRSDVTPNVGIGFSFHEWRTSNCGPFQPIPGMKYAFAATRIREPSWQSKTSNVVNKYFHTMGGLSYSLGFSASGPSVSISPTSEQWSWAVYASFSH